VAGATSRRNEQAQQGSRCIGYYYILENTPREGAFHISHLSHLAHLASQAFHISHLRHLASRTSRLRQHLE
jgi:hypothetical protein